MEVEKENLVCIILFVFPFSFLFSFFLFFSLSGLFSRPPMSPQSVLFCSTLFCFPFLECPLACIYLYWALNFYSN